MSCLFQSLSYFINGMDEQAMRQKICDFLETNPQLIHDMSLSDMLLYTENIKHPNEYIRMMRNDNTWGGAIEIKAFCELYQIAVDVHILSNDKTVLFTPERHPCPSRVRIQWQGMHYIPLPY